MKRVALTLAVIAVLGLAATTARAAGPHGAHLAVSSISRHLSPGYHHGGHGSYYGHPGSVVVQPRIYRYPTIGYPILGYPVVAQPVVTYAPVRRVYRHEYYPQYPQTSISYHGRGFGFSIGF